MKYHYQIISSFDPTDIPVNSKKLHKIDNASEDHEGFYSWAEADTTGEEILKVKKLNPDQYYIKVIPVPETVIEEDELQGHCYPGHETWED